MSPASSGVQPYRLDCEFERLLRSQSPLSELQTRDVRALLARYHAKFNEIGAPEAQLVQERHRLKKIVGKLSKDDPSPETSQREKDLEQLKLIAIEKELLDIKLRRSQLNRLAQRASSLLAPIRRLPLEILVEIFMRVADGTPGSVPYLLRVCSFWTAVVLDTPQLWDRLFVTRKMSPDSFANLATKWFARSKDLPLSLSLREPNSTFSWSQNPTAVQEIFSTLRDTLARVQHLEVDVDMFPSIDSLLECTPDITHLILHYNSSRSEPLLSTRVQRTVGHLRRLASLTVTQNGYQWWQYLDSHPIPTTNFDLTSFPQKDLTSVYLYGLCLSRSSWEALMTCKSFSRKIQHAAFTVVVVDPLPPKSIIPFTSLRTLSIEFVRQRGGDIKEIRNPLENFSFPFLTELALDGGVWQDRKFSCLHAPNVQELKLSNATIEADDVCLRLLTLPHLRRLALSKVRTDLNVVFNLLIDDPACAPKLSSIVLLDRYDDIALLERELVQRLIETRGSSRFRVEVCSTYYKAEKPMSLEEYLRGVVAEVN
ncbi:hypothetical protein CPC08DRAFT_770759 [Agrocybe pediades]|nr:hypothetical protein CPC08DRAFT_770759 [Agrocybe pediades]